MIWNNVRNTILLAVFALSILALSAGPFGTNLLSNPGFESDWADWSTTPGGNGWMIDDGWPNSGNKCVT